MIASTYTTPFVLSKQAEAWQRHLEYHSKQNIEHAGGNNRGCHDPKPALFVKDEHYSGNKGWRRHHVSCDAKKTGIGISDEKAHKQPY